MSRRFYTSLPLAPGLVVLEGAEARHLASVSRVRQGEFVVLFNGDGLEYVAEVVEVGRRDATLRVDRVECPKTEMSTRLTVAAPVPKGDRAQFLVEKLTELGVARFVPLSTRRTVVHPGDGKRDKLERYVIEASKQCGRNKLMVVDDCTEWSNFLSRPDLPRVRAFANLGGPGWPEILGEDVVLAVGPEGGWTDEEETLGQAHGWRPIGLGPRTLRIETAALALAVRFGGAQ